ncbi:hypothetical protein V495_01769 [Pseudogymnoascus sp. VKM F-4514 (FW-929)]|nr:hypothetical protein V495_01769 [Pseudogymnoascus sp. VKM F-4514 (FW-929)]KFY59262.1 hypothetical protein V497_04415 [Pseudogymnoascus sp. VKM F-4516 (FW-969)]
MRPFSVALSTALTLTTATGHYTFPALINNGAMTADWEYVRQWTGYNTLKPVTDVTSLDIRCNIDASAVSAPGVLSIAAGSQLGFAIKPQVVHPGPMAVYMAQVPDGSDAANWDGSGNVWFKIMESGATNQGNPLDWAYVGTNKVTFTLPATLPSGQYLVRIESIALHQAQTVGGAQFYHSCGQIEVTGGGSGNPGPVVAFPGAYSATDPGILIDLWSPSDMISQQMAWQK